MKIRHFCLFCVIPAVCSLLVYNLQIFLLTLTFVFYFDLIFAYKLVILKKFLFVHGKIKLTNLLPVVHYFT